MIDLARLLSAFYGVGYIGHPRLAKLIEENKITDIGFLAGEEEAAAFEAKEYVKLHQSTLRKVNIFAHIADLTLDGTLKTNATRAEIYGSEFAYWLDLCRDHWIITLLAIAGSIASIIGLAQQFPVPEVESDIFRKDFAQNRPSTSGGVNKSSGNCWDWHSFSNEMPARRITRRNYRLGAADNQRRRLPLGLISRQASFPTSTSDTVVSLSNCALPKSPHYPKKRPSTLEATAKPVPSTALAGQGRVAALGRTIADNSQPRLLSGSLLGCHAQPIEPTLPKPVPAILLMANHLVCVSRGRNRRFRSCG